MFFLTRGTLTILLFSYNIFFNILGLIACYNNKIIPHKKFTAIEDPNFHPPTCPTRLLACPLTAAQWTSIRFRNRGRQGTVL